MADGSTDATRSGPTRPRRGARIARRCRAVLLGIAVCAAVAVQDPATAQAAVVPRVFVTSPLVMPGSTTFTTALPAHVTAILPIGNAGTNPLGIFGLGITGDTSFHVTADGCTGHVLASMGQCDVDVTFAPTAAGTFTGTLVVGAVDTTDSATFAGATSLTGTALNTGPPGNTTAGYWLAESDGGVIGIGPPPPIFGSMAGRPLNQPIVGIAKTPTDSGYWLVASDGGVFPFGDAAGHGSTGGIRLNKPVVGIAATPDGRGYWLVASDGGIFPFGDARGFGSTGAVRLNKPVVGMAVTPDGGGYWLVASDGGIFPFGDAGGYGSTGAIRLNSPIVGMARTSDGGGYWLVASDGGIFPFGDAAGLGSTGAMRLSHPITAMATTPDGRGYWLIDTQGGSFAFGDAFPGLSANPAATSRVVGVAPL